MRQNTVVIADDHPIVREGLVSLLREHQFDVVASVGDGRSLLETTRTLRPDVIVTDISMPGLSGMEALPHLITASAGSKVIVLTMHDDAELVCSAGTRRLSSSGTPLQKR